MGRNEECFTLNVMIMATPIAPTPELTGRAAEKFLEDLANMEKASPERIQLMKDRARQVEKILTFDF